MKRKLNEKASDTDKEKVQRRDDSASLGIIPPRGCIQTAFFFSRCRDSKMITLFCVVWRWIMTTLNCEKLTTRMAILMPVGLPTVGSELLRSRGRYAHRCVYWCLVIHWRVCVWSGSMRVW